MPYHILGIGKTYTLTVRAESAYHFYSEPTELIFTAEGKSNINTDKYTEQT